MSRWPNFSPGGPHRTRLPVVLATLAVLVVAILAGAVTITVRYRNGLEAGLRDELTAGGAALQRAAPGQLDRVIASLALEGVRVHLTGPAMPAKPGASPRAPLKPGTLANAGQLLSLSIPLRATDNATGAVLSASRQPINRSVRRLIVTELIAFLLIALLTSGLARLAIALDRAVGQAERSETAMRRFLADASHELRTPIAALQATAETLLREQPDRPERDRLEAEVARGAQRLGRLTDDLLNTMRLDAAGLPPGAPVDLVTLTSAVIGETRARSNGTTIDLLGADPDQPRVTAIADADTLRRALANLLDNALAASGAHGHVQVTVRSAGSDALISVSDDGPGVPATDRETIFEPFARLTPSTTPGHGLGLPIARQIARQHHGELTCDAVPHGARFTLRIPGAQQPPEPCGPPGAPGSRHE